MQVREFPSPMEYVRRQLPPLRRPARWRASGYRQAHAVHGHARPKRGSRRNGSGEDRDAPAGWRRGDTFYNAYFLYNSGKNVAPVLAVSHKL